MAVQIQVSDETWKKLKDMKSRPSEFFDEIISRALHNMEESK